MRTNGKKGKFTAVDLFSGCGGLTLGLKQAGFKVVGAVEIDELAAETYRTNHPEVYLWQNDIRKITGKQILKTLKLKTGELTLLAGCPPCQGFSSIRTHNGGKRIVDRRNDLVFEYLRLVKSLKPKIVMMENVPALAENYRMLELKKELEKLGYKLGDTPTVLNAADYGVPQRRRRMILLGAKDKSITMPEPVKKIRTVKDAIFKVSKIGNSNDPLHDYPEKRTSDIIKIISLIPKDGGSRISLPKKYWLECHKRYPGGFKDVYGRLSWNDVSSTITGGCVSPSKGRFLHPSQNRSITLREAALLQTFPSNYYFSLKRGRQGAALMIGNALPPAFIKIHAQAVKKHLIENNV